MNPDESMPPNRDRLTVDLTGLIERIEKCREDKAYWQELSLTGKVRVLLLEYLEQIESQPQKE
ncbi:MAG: hypothetical protein SAJ12_23565 [Jaaginema sp. PMC 1079.18]|nr:hypothetical protein [Jaaginema sp. PMC 1080.18]MEC4853971.1 hypothetical protein [Jaaginema sp. PMC 1079.18]MEC4868895.1 hypothetical protein [Jaaginema sp. PMC 1078.18]